MAVGPLKIGSGLLVQIELGFRLREMGIRTAGQAAKSKSQLEQAGDATETDQRLGAAAAMTFEGQVPGLKPEFPKGQLAFDGAPDFRRRQGRQIRGGRGSRRGFSAVDFGQDRFPFGPPAPLRLALAALPVNHGGVEEPWRAAGQAAMGPQGAAERDEGGAKVIRRTREGTQGEPNPARHGGAHRPAASIAEPGQGFTFCLPR